MQPQRYILLSLLLPAAAAGQPRLLQPALARPVAVITNANILPIQAAACRSRARCCWQRVRYSCGVLVRDPLGNFSWLART